MEKRDAWNVFKVHTMYLEDNDMRNRTLAVIDSTPDPFACEIRYHYSCLKKYIHTWQQNDSWLHIQQVRLSEVKQLFFQHIREVIFEQNELRTLQGLLSDYKSLLSNFGFGSDEKK